MRHILLIASFLGIVLQTSVVAQDKKKPHNLVYNPSFEEYLECPQRIEASGQLTIVEGWYQPTSGSADYFNQCSQQSCGIPRNKMGYQQPHSGNGYCGIYCNKTEYREYIQTELKESLQAGCIYHLSFYVSLSEYSTCGIATMGGLLTTNRLEDTSHRVLSQQETRDLGWGTTQTISTYYTPQVQNSRDSVLLDWRRWQKVEGTFTVQGGERFLTIGNFLPASKSGIMDDDSLTHELTGAYYFIDDVSLTLQQCPKPVKLDNNPSVSKTKPEQVQNNNTPEKQPVDVQTSFEENQIKKGSTIILHNIFFEFDKSTLLQQSYNELQRLLSLLHHYPTMKIMIIGHTDSKGEAVYNMRLSESRAKAVVEYLIKKGIDTKRLQWKGRGSFEPVDTNATEAGRANNRRVEMKILSM